MLLYYYSCLNFSAEKEEWYICGLFRSHTSFNRNTCFNLFVNKFYSCTQNCKIEYNTKLWNSYLYHSSQYNSNLQYNSIFFQNLPLKTCNLKMLLKQIMIINEFDSTKWPIKVVVDSMKSLI